MRLGIKSGIAAAIALILVALMGLSCRRTSPIAEQQPSSPPWFVDVTDDVGLNFVHDAGPTGGFFMPQIMGSGAALFDFDNDRRLDIYLIHNAGPQSRSTNRLFRQGADGRFVDVSEDSGLDVAGYGMGAAAGDVNNDGWVDLVLTEYGKVRLFLNDRNGKSFTDATQSSGLAHVSWGTSATLFDYDRDGWLDLAVVSYVDYDPSRDCTGRGGKPDYCHPNTFGGTVPRLFRNLGAKAATARFEDVSLKTGIARMTGNGLGVVAADFDADGWPDLFFANDAQANRLWLNRQGTFREEAALRGLAYNGMGQPQANMGIALGDVDGDGLFDVFVTHLTEELHTLWKQERAGQFSDRTAAAGLANPRWRGTGFGTVLADFDCDGDLDLAIVNGRVAQGSSPTERPPAVEDRLGLFWSRYAERNQLFENDGNGRFRDISINNGKFSDQPHVSRGLVWGDIDGDGAVDLLVTTVAGPARLYRNVAPERGHWLIVRAVDPALKRDAHGARITVHAGNRRWLGWVNPGSSYLCSNDPRVHFGVGPLDKIDAIEVLWPDGKAEDFAGSAVDRAIEVRKGEGRAK